MRMMKDKIKSICKITASAMVVGMCLAGCDVKDADVDLGTPEKAIESTMGAIKEVDMTAFNASTDNYVRSYKNWLGITTDKEYRVFNELQQTGDVRKKKREANLKFARKMAEDL